MVHRRGGPCLLVLLGLWLTAVPAIAEVTASGATAAECVVLLHGLGRTERSMRPLGRKLSAAGYLIVNEGYPSRDHDIAALTPLAIEPALARCRARRAARIHFVTHSLGGILVRHYLAGESVDELGRVVMLAPPNQGSEVVDALRNTPGFGLVNGKAGFELGTDERSVPRRLGPADFDVGVIAGTRSINLWLSRFLPNPDDGKVSAASARLEGMRDFLLVPHSHPFVMRRKAVINQVLHYLEHGAFRRDAL
ncbi:MAG: alpha/beta fold hydrolase [Pseudomonadota bacterium]